MNGSSIYERLRKEQHMYCQGKRPSVLKIACRYIEGLIGLKPRKTQYQMHLEYGISMHGLYVRYREIMKLLKIEGYEWL